jgi:hypothetical protein
MKTKLFAVLLLIYSIFPQTPVLSQTPNKCSLKDEFIAQVDSETPICRNVFMGDKFKFISFYIRRKNKNTGFVSSVNVMLTDSSAKIVTIHDDFLMGTQFYLIGRRFGDWMEHPRADLVEKYRSDLTAILNAIAEYNKRPENSEF